MKVYEYAMKVELEGKLFYEALAKQSSSIGLEKIFMMLASEEQKHFELFQELNERERVELNSSHILQDASMLFHDLQNKSPALSYSQDEILVYEKALSLEESNEVFYKEQAKFAKSNEEKHVFENLAKEEQKHAIIMQNLVEFVNQPNTWIENAEFVHAMNEEAS